MAKATDNRRKFICGKCGNRMDVMALAKYSYKKIVCYKCSFSVKYKQ